MEKIIHHVHRHVHKVRSHPEHVRQRILQVATIVCGALLIILWIFSLGRNISDPNRRVEVKKDMEPLSVFKSNIVGGYKSMTATVTESEEYYGQE